MRSVRMGIKMAEKVGISAEENGIRLSAHAPYYINLNSKEPQKIIDSRRRIFESALRLDKAGGNNVVFHIGFYQDIPHSESIENVIRELRLLRKELDQSGMEHITLRPELTGKKSQIGSEEELFYISEKVENTLPCIDFSHYYARYTGGRSFDKLFDYIKRHRPDYMYNMHCHISGIEFTEKGEKRHISLSECNMNWQKIISLFIDFECRGTVICESPLLEKDSLLMKTEYEKRFKVRENL